MTDGVAFLIALAVLLGLVGLGEGLRGLVGAGSAVPRRVVHAGVGLVVAATPLAFSSPGPVYGLGLLFIAGNAWARWKDRFQGIHGGRPESIGTITFPLALLPALFVCWTLDVGRVYILQIAFLILALADPMAAWVGERWGRRSAFAVGRGQKSPVGTLAFFGVALLVTLSALGLVAPPGGWSDYMIVAVIVAAVTTAVELLGGRGWDNFFIVQAGVVALVVWHEQPARALDLLGAVGLGVAFGILAYRLRFLDRSGAIAGGLLAASLIGLGGLAWAVPAFTFFVLSSLLSKAVRRQTAAAAGHDEKGHVRDAGQVIANGGVGWACLLVFAVWPSGTGWLEATYWGFLGAFAAATADTWATEIGIYAGGTPRSLLSGKLVPPGTSGAVSVAGTLGGLLGAVVIWGAAVLSTPAAWAGAAWGGTLWAVAGGGFAAAWLDSLLGATVQARYRDAETGLQTERATSAGRPNVLVRGHRWLTNDRVNLSATAFGALWAVLFYGISGVAS